MTYDPILCNALDEEVLETKDDTDDVSNEPICPQYSDVRPSRGYIREYYACYLVIMENLFINA